MTKITQQLVQRLTALAWGALAVFVAVSLLTYDRADPVPQLPRPLNFLYQPDRLVDPPHPAPTNACGLAGAVAADLLFHTIGISAYLLVLLLAWQAWRSWLGERSEAPRIQLIGAMLTLASVSALAALVAPRWSPGPVIGSGGYLGALMATALRQYFALVGASIVALSSIAAGLLLLADDTLLAPLAKLVRYVVPAAGRLASRWPRHLGTQQEDTASGAADGPAVKIGGTTIEVADDEDEEWEDDDEEEWETDEDVADEAEAEDDEEAEEPAPLPIKVKRRKRRPRAAQEPLDRDRVMDQLDQASLPTAQHDYVLPSVELLDEPSDFCFDEQAREVRRKAKILEKTFANFGFNVRVVEIETGPVIAQYEVELEAGLRLSKITGLADDLAIALRVPSVRIVAPIPGKNTVGIEVPNETRQIVHLREVMEETSHKADKMKIPLYLGKDVSGSPLVVDLASMPHLLIAGRTGTGKSVCLNAIITSMLMTRRPDEVRMLLIDPKMVELSGYGRLPHLMHPVVTDMRKAEAILAWAVEKMEERYALLAKAGVRHITGYNQLGREELLKRLQPADEAEANAIPPKLPFIVIVADEMADLMMTAGKDVEQHIIRLAQKSRAVGIHLILATQKPTVDVITGLIKSNLPARISFQVASRTDSRVVLDEMGADKLLGNGDMLFLWPGTSTLIRGQGTYVTDDEITRVVDAVSTGEQNFVSELVSLKVDDDKDGAPEAVRKRDELYEQAIEIVVREGRGSVSLLQRCLGIGYGRAARLIDYMAEDGIVGEYAGSHAREVLITMADWERMQANGQANDEPSERSANVVSVAANQDDAPWDDEWEEDDAEAAADVDEDGADEYEEAAEYEEEYEEEAEYEQDDDPDGALADEEWGEDDTEDEGEWDEDEWEYEYEDEGVEVDAPADEDGEGEEWEDEDLAESA